MRILHVANFSINKYGSVFYATDRKISSGLIKNNHFVYDFSYRDICRSESVFRSTKFGTSKVNKRLLQSCDNLRPELLLLGHSELITAETLAEIKNRFPSIKIALWYVDALWNKKKTAHLFERLSNIDIIFATTSGEYLKEFVIRTNSAAFIPNIVDETIESKQAFAEDHHDHDLIFCGRDSQEPERQEFLEKVLREAGKHVRTAFRGCLGQPLVTGYQYLEFLGSSKMGLNISRRNDVPLCSSGRLAQLVGNGLLTFCPNVPGMRTLFSDSELVYFDSLEELIEKIIYYHTHDKERNEVAKNGWLRAQNSFNSKRVTQYMIERIFDLPLSEQYEWEEEFFSHVT